MICDRGEPYCYYHGKVSAGLITSFNDRGAKSWRYDVPPTTFYPVWPLPEWGYVLLPEDANAD